VIAHDQAIAQLTRSGFLHYAAIANELAALRMVRKNDEFWASHYFEQVCELVDVSGIEVMVSRQTNTASIRLSTSLQSYIRNGGLL